MKLCFLAGTDSIHSQRWIRYFANKGHEIHWISLTSESGTDIKNVKLYRLKKTSSKLLNLPNVIQVKKLIKKINPDILHAHYAKKNGIIGALSGFHPFLLTTWGSDVLIAPKKSTILKWLVKFALNKADLITCDAEHMREAMIKLGVNSSKIQIVYFGIDTEKFSSGPKDENLIQKLKIKNSPVVISSRNLEPIYNLETLIKAIPLVLKEVSETKFIIIGKGSEEEKLKNLAKDLKVTENIRFVGFIPNEEMLKYLRTADIYVSTSLSDAGLSSCTAEAMACGLPVIITDTGENEKWVKDDQGGYLVPTKNLKALAQKIINLIKNENLRKEFSKTSRKVIGERNDYYKEMAKMEKIYLDFGNKG